jgi:hypothetical protein
VSASVLSVARRSRPGLRNAVLLAIALLLGLLHVALVLQPDVMSPADPVWQHVQGDRAQAVFGAEAFQRDRSWRFPLTLTNRVQSGGAPVAIIYTDSAPWLSVAARALGFGPEQLSVVGLIAFLATTMQPVACALLMLAAGLRRPEAVLGGAVLGALMPAWYMRLIWHPALASHWIVVLALALAFLAVRRGLTGRVVAGLAALGAFAIGIHAYLFVMVAALAAGACLAEPARQLGWRSLARGVGGLAVFLACSGASAWLLGYGGGGPAGGFGVFSMNLLAPFVPQASGLRAALTGDPGAYVDATGGQYEGCVYLGAGILLLLVATLAAGAVARRWPRMPRAAVPLGLAIIALLIYAVSNQVWLGHILLLKIKLSSALDQRFGQLRGSGRMAWPACYALLALLLRTLERWPRRVAAAVLAVALLLQVADTRLVRRSLAAEYVPSNAPVPPRAELWQNGPFAGRTLRFMPSMACGSPADGELIRQLALIAERSGGAVDGGPLARSAPEVCANDRFDAALDAGGQAGVVQLLLASGMPASVMALAASSGRCAALPEGLACGPDAVAARSAGLLPAPSAPAVLPRLRAGEAMGFGTGAPGTQLLAAGWLNPEGFGTWTSGERALLVLPLPESWRSDATVTFHAIAYGASPLHRQLVTMLADGHAIAQLQVSMLRWDDYAVTIPASAIRDSMAVLELVVPYPLLHNRRFKLKHDPHGFGLGSATLGR